MNAIKRIYFVSDTGAVYATNSDRHGAREALIARMKALGYEPATRKEFVRKRAWQRRQEKKEEPMALGPRNA